MYTSTVLTFARSNILVLDDPDFTPDNVCIVAGAGSELGRAISIAAAVNKLMTVGIDTREEEGKATQKMAREMGGQMIFLRGDLADEKEAAFTISEAAKLGRIRFLANVLDIEKARAVVTALTEPLPNCLRRILSPYLGLTVLAVAHMEASPSGKGTVGNAVCFPSKYPDATLPAPDFAAKLLTELNGSIAAGSSGKIRSFAILPATPQPDSPPRETALVLANHLIFGFSGFFGAAVGSGIRMDRIQSL